MKYLISYDIEYSDGSCGQGSHGEYDTYDEAVEAKNTMRDREYTPQELESAPMYYNFSIEEVKGEGKNG